MQRLSTRILQHVTRDGEHYDWLLAEPGPRALTGPLVTYRIALPPRLWAEAGRLDLTALPDHRRAYLSYEGPISGERGWVRQADQGSYVPLLWGEDRRVLAVSLEGWRGRASLRRIGPERWQSFFWTLSDDEL